MNGATNLTYLPMFEGVDKLHPNSSLHYNWNGVHAEYNAMVKQRVMDLLTEATENGWDDKLVRKKIQDMQKNLKRDLKMGVIKCH